MLLQPYELDELEFAFCHRVYFRWRTHRRVPRPELARLDVDTLNDLVDAHDIRVLESQCSDTDSLALVSLKPGDAVSAAAGKLKGKVSKWLRGELGLQQPEQLLSRGYFACTAGKNTLEEVEQYLYRQAEHHGYSNRPRPPVFVRVFESSPRDDARLHATHASTIVQYHIVLSTWRRRGVFSQAAAEALAGCWCRIQAEHRFVLRKVSFVPDHVHIAVRVHPSAAPAALVVHLMNASQRLMWDEFDDNVIRAGVERLWQPGGYIGSFGELASPQVRQYIRTWDGATDDTGD